MLAYLASHLFVLPGFVLQGLVLVALVRRKLIEEFRLFFWYTIAHLVFDVALFASGSLSAWANFYTYWSIEAIDAVLTLIVIESVFLKIFESYPALEKLGNVVFRWATAVFCVLAILVALGTHGSKDDQVTHAVFVMDSCIQFVQVGLLLCLFLFSRLFGLAWRHQIYGILLGFGLNATVTLIASSIRTQLGPAYHHILRSLFPAAYITAILTWAYYLLSRKAVEVSAMPPTSAYLRAWNQALGEFLRK